MTRSPPAGGSIKQLFRPHHGAPSDAIEFHPVSLSAADHYLDFTLQIDPTDAHYDRSKLYFASAPGEPFDESRVLCFRLHLRATPERVRLRVPQEAMRSGYLRLRLDGLPASPGKITCSAVTLSDGEVDLELTRAAELQRLKEIARLGVAQSEAQGRAVLPHFPESMSIELTARCNLTCSHCSSHGEAGEHQRNNRRAAFDPVMLEKLAHEVFPHLSAVTLVGRGEPLMIGVPLWRTLIDLLRDYGVFLSCVTNGYFLRDRLTLDMIEIVDTIMVSIDGMTPQTFAENRGGASLHRVLDNIEYYDTLRRQLPLARRPRLGFSWTIKRNNIAELPAFARMILRYEPSVFYARHLFTFRDKDAPQSLVGEAALVNPLLHDAYAVLAGHGIQLDAPPLMAEA